MTCIVSRRALALAAASMVSIGLSAPYCLADTFTGEPTAIGAGETYVIVETDAADMPVSIAIAMTPGAVDGISMHPNSATPDGSYEYNLALPSAVETGYREVTVNWHPHGHPPPHVYTVPHFDFHFYTIEPADRMAIAFTGADDPAVQVNDVALIPADYQVIPDTAVPMMGVHTIDMTAPELNGQPFTETFIYGYYGGKLVFLEPMVTQAFLQTRPDLTQPVKTPERYSQPGHYPTSYSVRYDAESDVYLIQLGGLQAWR